MAVLSIRNASESQVEGDPGRATFFIFEVTRAGDASAPALVDYYTAYDVGPGAADERDFADGSFPAGTLYFNAGATTARFMIQTSTDKDFEPNERFTIALSNPRGGDTIGTDRATATIVNDDAGAPPPPPPAMIDWGTPRSGIILSEADAGGFTTYTYEATRSGNTSGTTTVDWRVDLGSTNANDYAGPLSGTITFAPGQTSQTFNVLVAGDGTIESDESFQVQLSNASNASVTLEERNGRIINDDGGRDIPTTYSIANAGPADKAEGTGTNTPFEFTVTRNGEASGPGMVDYFTLGQTDAADFSGPTTGTVYFAPGETTKIIGLDVAGDATPESDESFTVGLSNPRGGTIATSQANRKIINDDPDAPRPASVSISGPGTKPVGDSSNTIFAEGTGSNTILDYTVTRSGDVSTFVVVDYFLIGETDSADFSGPTTSTVYFSPGETTKVIQIAVVGDNLAEPNEDFMVGLSNARGASIGVGSVTATINNDDGWVIT